MVRLIRSVFFCAFALGGISTSALASEIQLPKDYASLRCLPAYDGDDCLPTATYARWHRKVTPTESSGSSNF